MVVGGKDPWLFFNKAMEIAFPANTKRQKMLTKKLKDELELRKLNCEWQEDFEGVFGLMN